MQSHVNLGLLAPMPGVEQLGASKAMFYMNEIMLLRRSAWRELSAIQLTSMHGQLHWVDKPIDFWW